MTWRFDYVPKDKQETCTYDEMVDFLTVSVDILLEDISPAKHLLNNVWDGSSSLLSERRAVVAELINLWDMLGKTDGSI